VLHANNSVFKILISNLLTNIYFLGKFLPLFPVNIFLIIDRTKSTGEEKEGGDMEPQQNPYEKAITNTYGT
jgi:hypothetical protein